MAAQLRSQRNMIAGGIVLLALLTLPACNDNKNPSAPTGGGGGNGPITFVGVAAGAAVGGKLAFSLPVGIAPEPQAGPFSSRGLINVSGTFSPTGAAAIGLNGTYDQTSEYLILSGGNYTFTGTYFSGVLRGNWARTPSPAVGTFVLVQANSASSVHAYCGTFTSTSGGEGGIFDFVTQGTTVDGIACTSSGTETRLQGTLAGTAITLVNPLNPGPYLATGTLSTSTDTVSGTYNDGAGNSGTWAGVGS